MQGLVCIKPLEFKQLKCHLQMDTNIHNNKPNNIQ